MLYMKKMAQSWRILFIFMCSIKDTGQDIKKNVKYIKVPFQPFDILMKANHPKTIISVADEENLNVWF